MAAAPRVSAIRRLLIAYCVVLLLICGCFALAAVTIVTAADRDRAIALIDGDATATLDKLAGPAELRRDKAMAIVLARTAIADDERVYQLVDNGRVIAGSAAQLGPDGDGWLAARHPRVLARPVTLAPGIELRIGRRLESGAPTRALRVSGIAAVLLALAAAAGLGAWAGRRLAARIDAINRACDQVRLGDLRVRAPGGEGKDEFAALARHVNAMLDQIDSLIAGLRSVSNQIAHDLRTPIARLRSDLEDAAHAPDLRAARELAGAAVAETDEILETFEALLDIAEVEAGGAAGLAPLALDEVVRAAIDLYAGVAEAAGITVVPRLERVAILGERTLLVRLAANVIDNAIKFSLPGGTVGVVLRREEGSALLQVEDAGPGICAAEREAVLGRFARGSAGRGVPGVGLGLALVAAVAKRHGATIAMADAAPGLSLRVRFPALAA